MAHGIPQSGLNRQGRRTVGAMLRHFASAVGLGYRPEPSYDAAGTGMRNSTWRVTAASINAILTGTAEDLRFKSQAMARNNPWAVQGLRSWTANAIGTGIVPIPKHPDEVIRKRVRDLFERWTDESDAHGVTDFYGQQMIVAMDVKRAGETLGRFRERFPEDGLSVPLQVQLMSADHLPHALTRPVGNGNALRQGIEFNAIEQKVAYHLQREHPGELPVMGRINDIVRVPAADVIHVFSPLYPGQIRGVTDFGPVLARMRSFDTYEDGELTRKAVTAQPAGFIKEAPGQTGAPMVPGQRVASDGSGEYVTSQPGAYIKLNPGEEIINATAAEMGEGYADFMRWVLRAIAAGLGITYEQLTGDLTGVNYSSIRAGLLEFRRAMEQWQHSVFIFQFCRPVWNRWLDVAALNGALGISANQYWKERHLFRLVDWQPPGWSWVDPEKELKAVCLAIRNGIMSREQAVALTGFTAEQIDQQQASDNKRADKQRLRYDSDGRYPLNGGGGGAAPNVSNHTVETDDAAPGGDLEDAA